MTRSKWLRGLALFFIWVVSLGALGYTLDKQYVIQQVVLNAGIRKARECLESDRCKVAFAAEGSEYGQLNLPKTFGRTRAVPVAWLWPPIANGVANCDVSTNTYLVGTNRAMWGGARALARTHIHELVHIIDCPDLLAKWGSQEILGWVANGVLGTPEEQVEAAAYITEAENKAYRVSNLCVGTPVPEFAKKKKKEKDNA